MSAGDYIILAAIALGLILALRHIRKKKKSGRGCCGSCGSCPMAGSCHSAKRGPDGGDA